MRTLTKLACPQILSASKLTWDAAYAANPNNGTAKYRYRHSDIKETLKKETSGKCIYCESKIGHNTPGDVEHKWPSSVHQHLHFEWTNLTIACTECNRRKLALDPSVVPFLDPYQPGVEQRVRHYGPVVGWVEGDQAAETTVRRLELDSSERLELVLRKIEKISDINNLKERVASAPNPVLKAALQADLQRRASASEEFSGMVASLI
ncbi:HNH endonuclease [Sphingobium bisphenolivorans]|uniref:HNH endonuclease n=1 Tax=Sphingobium bisphenolivorans TaxID=1335760 RepID=UPI00126A18DF|nr:HNH endonuclease [Sphingobium bisphenolivorans]